MTRIHRKTHRLIWPLLAAAVVFGLILAVERRPPPDPPVASETMP